ncbi:MAG: hypothetical protein RBT30_00050 [Patescibacteria group bacterium]|jgi:hypothetical protein|nr:hypothetical protein [Patescibacteria group bacterium]
MNSVWWRKNLENILVALTALLFLAGTAFLVSSVQDSAYTKFLSPDETANYFFINNYASEGNIAVFEEANLFGEEIVHPRSIRSDHAWLKPVSFLGIILLYAHLAMLVGPQLIPYFTPFFATLGIIFFYAFVRQLWGKKTALIAAILLASFPVYIFYTVRSLFHNVLFVVFLLGSAYFLLLTIKHSIIKKRAFLAWSFDRQTLIANGSAFLSGLFLGGAIASRSSELIWLGPLFLLIWLFYARRLSLLTIVTGIFALLLSLLPVFYWNQILYSSPFYGGYSEMNASLQQISQASGEILHINLQNSISRLENVWRVLKDNIFYFGYHPRQSLEMFYYYVIKMFPLLCLFTAFGFIIFAFKWLKRPKKGAVLYLLSWFLLSVILVLYYGSWQFNDNPDPSRFTIGNSYTRYWLPIYIMAMPFAAFFIVRFSKLFASLSRFIKLEAWRLRGQNYLYLLMASLLTGFYIFISLSFVFFGSEEGLMTLYYNHFRDRQDAAAILESTEEEAIIITQYHDKQLFPERKIVSALLTNNDVNEVISQLVKYYPVYYYNFAFPEKDLLYLNERKLPNFNLQIEPIKRRGPFALYLVKPMIVNDETLLAQ